MGYGFYAKTTDDDFTTVPGVVKTDDGMWRCGPRGGMQKKVPYSFDPQATVSKRVCPKTRGKIWGSIRDNLTATYSVNNWNGGGVNCTKWAIDRLEAGGLKVDVPLGLLTRPNSFKNFNSSTLTK